MNVLSHQYNPLLCFFPFFRRRREQVEDQVSGPIPELFLIEHCMEPPSFSTLHPLSSVECNCIMVEIHANLSKRKQHADGNVARYVANRKVCRKRGYGGMNRRTASSCVAEPTKSQSNRARAGSVLIKTRPFHSPFHPLTFPPLPPAPCS